MKKLLLPIAAVAAMAAAAPAYADHDRHSSRHYGDYYRGDYRGASQWYRSVEARADRLAYAVEDARRSRHISDSLAKSIMGQVRAAVRNARKYAQSGLTEDRVAATERRFRDQELRLRTGDYHAAERQYRYGYAPRW